MMKPVIDEINKVIYKIFKKKSAILAELIINWGKIVGIEWKSNSYPYRVVASKERGKKINILYIATDNPSISMQMSYQQEVILERIAVYLGYKAIHKIRFTVKK